MRKFNFLFVLLGVIFGAYFSLWQPQLLERGFQISDLAFLLTIQTVLAVLVDIPSGYISDKLGHKFTTIIGFFLYVVGLVCPFIRQDALALAVGVIFVGIGASVVNGALESWVSDIQEAESGELNVKHFLTRDQFQRVGMIVGAIALPGLITLGQLGSKTLWLPLLLSSCALIGYAFALPKGIEKQKPSANVKVPVFEILKASPSIFLMGLTFGISNGMMDVSLWARFKDLGLDTPILFGLIQAGFSVSRAIGAGFWKISGIESPERLVVLSLLISSIFYLAFPFLQNPVIAASVWFIRIAILSAVFSAASSLVLAKFRVINLGATALSTYTVTMAIGSSIATFAVGVVGEQLNVQMLLVIGALMSVVAGVCVALGEHSK